MVQIWYGFKRVHVCVRVFVCVWGGGSWKAPLLQMRPSGFFFDSYRRAPAGVAAQSVPAKHVFSSVRLPPPLTPPSATSDSMCTFKREREGSEGPCLITMCMPCD